MGFQKWEEKNVIRRKTIKNVWIEWILKNFHWNRLTFVNLFGHIRQNLNFVALCWLVFFFFLPWNQFCSFSLFYLSFPYFTAWHIHKSAVAAASQFDIGCPWMHETPVDWIFQGPVCAVLIINLIFLLRIMWVSTRICRYVCMCAHIYLNVKYHCFNFPLLQYSCCYWSYCYSNCFVTFCDWIGCNCF